jgi:glutaredoxin
MKKVTLYTKPDCSLCDEAAATLERAGAGQRFELKRVDVSVDPRLLATYGERLPVVAVDGVEVSELVVDEQALERLLAVPAEAVR